MSAKIEFDSKHKKRSPNALTWPCYSLFFTKMGKTEEQSWHAATQNTCIYWWYQTPSIFSHCRCWLLIRSKCLLSNLAPNASAPSHTSLAAANQTFWRQSSLGTQPFDHLSQQKELQNFTQKCSWKALRLNAVMHVWHDWSLPSAALWIAAVSQGNMQSDKQ